ncbi:D-alanyl-D-alanine carboxypeptidase/D-alanyl-D-alanine-endopeptidase [Sulfitobacter sp. 1151]|uniref:D-alanyl-D-alanine carboxypeptidase/D-alanyl-D-alanine-endopeptidase n=2 Tax=Parasulfitobacter algicola TaxID=2614809 RepID=A0ABX2IXU2_9RHOB|nr:D-alanyl-D-alanine carboxypeptidase/D-alanyl-D-alanine-endopeptidase [Sulfitobacter algicola]NSX55912.1 D-alanyl-D-alanine carboxypeptidase/D-alanyl-D-alanine-endopeptidase [Sulfitobacter algicola]
MTSDISRRIFLTGLLSGTATGAFAAPPQISLIPVARPTNLIPAAIGSLDQIIASANLSGDVGFAVADAKTGQMLESRGARKALPPASVTKAITAPYALDVLGAGHRFRTQILANGPIQNGTLKGDLYLVGGGDPVLSTDDLADMAASVKAKGINRINGKFIVIGTALPFVYSIDQGQPDHHGYNATISGLNVNFNRVHFEWKRDGKEYVTIMGAPAQRFKPVVNVAQMQIVDRKLPVYTYRRGNRIERWTVARSALGKGGARWLPVRNPELYAGDVFRAVAIEQGISLPAATVSDKSAKGTLIAENRSPSLGSLCRGMLKYSTNLTAEALGMTSSQMRNGTVDGLSVSASEMTKWAKAKLGVNAKFVDHSGLGDASRMAPQDMVKALARLQSGALPSLLKPIPMRDNDYKVMKNHPVTVRAKTGTLNFVSSLAGYLTAKDGTELVFAIFTADLSKRQKGRSSGDDRPRGARGWNRRSRLMQQQLLQRWGHIYGS